MMATCPICGTRRVIYWPEHWVYRRGETYYCSEDCMRVDETKDMKLIKMIARVRARSKKGVQNMNGRITAEQKAKAIEMAIRGESPLAYLKQIGMKNPSSTWQYIKSTLKKTNPKKYAEIPEKPAKVETPEGGIVGPVTMKANDICRAIDGTPDAGPDMSAKLPADEGLPEVEKNGFGLPAYIDGFEIVGISGEFGTYRASAEHKYFEFVPFGGDLCMTPGDWQEQIKELNRAAKVLGVKL